MYCRITYKWSADRRGQGNYVLGNRALNAGQTAACEVRVPGCDGLEDEILAAFIPSGDGKGWILVRRTDFHDILVNGRMVGAASALKNGDEITFIKHGSAERLAVMHFEVHANDDCDMKTGIIYGHRKKTTAAAWIGSIAGIIAVCLAAFALTKDGDPLRYEVVGEYEASVYQIVTDSVFLMERGGGIDVVLEAVGLDNVENGTCFLTDDGLIVTARHCIEPWLEAGVSSPAVDMAVRAETMNRGLREEKYYVRSRNIVHYGDEDLVFHSDDFCMNRSRDMIINSGDYLNPRYFRTISPIASRRDMELGDFAYVQTGFKGTVSLASGDEIDGLGSYDDVVIFGYPRNDNNTDNRNMARGRVQSSERTKGCMQMSSSEIISGYSGGPVLGVIKGKGLSGDKIKVIGLVSKVDSRDDKATFWVVPSSEVIGLQLAGGKIEDDSFKYRR